MVGVSPYYWPNGMSGWTSHWDKVACAFEKMPFLSFWHLPCLLFSVPWCFLHPDTPFRFSCTGHVHAHICDPSLHISKWDLCLVHPWLKCPWCNTLHGDWCLWKWWCWQCPRMPHLRGAVVGISMLAALDTWYCVFLQVQKQHYHLILANSCPLSPAFRAGLKMWHCCYFHLFDFSFWVCK